MAGIIFLVILVVIAVVALVQAYDESRSKARPFSSGPVRPASAPCPSSLSPPRSLTPPIFLPVARWLLRSSFAPARKTQI